MRHVHSTFSINAFYIDHRKGIKRVKRGVGWEFSSTIGNRMEHTVLKLDFSVSGVFD